MLWGDEGDRNLLDYFRRLGALRKQFPMLTSGKREVVHLNLQNGTYAYLQASADSEVLIALNTNLCFQTIDVPISLRRDRDSEIAAYLARPPQWKSGDSIKRFRKNLACSAEWSVHCLKHS